MKIPKLIITELNKRGWTMLPGEQWRRAKGKDWACAYFRYVSNKQNRVCLITIAKNNLDFNIEILYKFPICSSYVVLKGKYFHVKL